MIEPPLDRVALGRYLRERDLCDGTPQVRLIGGGYSNLTYLVEDGARQVVLRRPPPPPIEPRSHDVVREARIQRTLAPTPVPVTPILAVEETGSVIGAPFYVMEYQDGTVVTTDTPPAIDTPTGRRELAEAFIDTLAELHLVDYAALGLTDYARPSLDVEKHLRRYLRAADPDSEGLDSGTGAEVVAVFEMLLEAPPPPKETTIVHGDFRLGNVMTANDPPSRLLAVLDWELSSIGDPMRDLGYVLGTWAVAGEEINSLTEMSTATLAEGYPGREELAARYAEKTGFDISDIGWHMATAIWKVGALYEGQSKLARKGLSNAYFAAPGRVAGIMAAARRLYESPAAWSVV